MTDPAGNARLLEQLARGFALTAAAIGAIGTTPWDVPTPCGDWDLRRLVAHVTLSTGELGRVARGEGVRPGAFADLDAVDVGADGDEARRRYEALAASTHAAFAAPGGLVGLRPWPMGDLPAPVIAGLALSDAVVHAWDIGQACGQPVRIPDDLAGPIEAFMRDMARDTRRAPFFGAPIAAAPGASPSDRLVAFTGRASGSWRAGPSDI
jgi:uncharacterized protein (TIGR03086 family)